MAAPLLPARLHTTQPTAALQQRICWTRFAADEPGFRAAVAEPSRADEVLISTLKTALSLVDVRVLDHLIVAGNDVMSFAERGLL